MPDQQDQAAIEPLEQEDVPFHGQSIVAVRLPDDRICVVLRWVCESLNLAPGRQVSRIQRTAAIANELVRVRVMTPGGIQPMPAITLRGFPVWILGISPNDIKDEHLKEMIIAYQVEAVDVLYKHFAQRRLALPEAQTIIPAEPVKPAPDANHVEQAAYHEAMALWHRWQADLHEQQWRGEIEEWRGSIEDRLESEKAVTDLIPEILERLGPATLTPEHHRRVQTLAQQLHRATGKAHSTIYNELKTIFEKPRIQDLLEDEWPQIERWFTVQIERAKG